ncbi:MAG: MoaD/ThiS family protein [gamma proteobacterium symbiont of Taylorina sp.]|nr:MoaD/ThiS family protein [gamma proteobacterium symbiont of Taylorina sp.]
MKITLKCFASLSRHLPAHARANAARVEIDENMSVHQVINFFKIDREEAYLVILNGVFVCPPERDSTILSENDTLALWPEVAGG